MRRRKGAEFTCVRHDRNVRFFVFLTQPAGGERERGRAFAEYAFVFLLSRHFPLASIPRVFGCEEKTKEKSLENGGGGERQVRPCYGCQECLNRVGLRFTALLARLSAQSVSRSM